MNRKSERRVRQAVDRLKAAKAADRLDEIARHGRPVNRPSVTRNRKKYTRKLKHRNLL